MTSSMSMYGGKDLVIPDDFTDPGLPSRGVFSASQHGMYHRCPRQYFYRYILGEKQKPGIAMTRGKAVHKGAEVTHQSTIDTGMPLKKEEALEAVANEFDRDVDNIELEKDDNPGHIKDQTIRNFSVYYDQAVPIVRPVEVERGFAIKFGTVPVIGFIDLVDEVLVERVEETDVPGEGPLVIEVVSDLKLTGKKWAAQKLRHEPQLTFYAHVVGTPNVRIDFLLDLKSGTRYVQERSLRNPNDVRLLVEDVEESVDNIKKGRFPRCDPTTWVCNDRFCGFYEKCRGPK